MKIVHLAFMLSILAFGLPEARGENGIGIGLIVGEPTGISIKKWIGGETRAVDAAAAWSLSKNESFQFHADYLPSTTMTSCPSRRSGCKAFN